METTMNIKVSGIELKGQVNECETTAMYFACGRNIVANEEEAKAILEEAIRKAIELCPSDVNRKYGIQVCIDETYNGVSYSMIARRKSDDEDLEKFLKEECPTLVTQLENGVEIIYGASRSSLPADKDFED